VKKTSGEAKSQGVAPCALHSASVAATSASSRSMPRPASMRALPIATATPSTSATMPCPAPGHHDVLTGLLTVHSKMTPMFCGLVRLQVACKYWMLGPATNRLSRGLVTTVCPQRAKTFHQAADNRACGRCILCELQTCASILKLYFAMSHYDSQNLQRMSAP
jgi:hypothetical protein